MSTKALHKLINTTVFTDSRDQQERVLHEENDLAAMLSSVTLFITLRGLSNSWNERSLQENNDLKHYDSTLSELYQFLSLCCYQEHS